MWCANCQADVAAEVSVDNQRIHCATCHTELEGMSRKSSGPATRNAQEILARWSNSKLLDPFGPVQATAAVTEPRSASQDRAIEPAAVIGTAEDRDGKVYRFEAAHEDSSASETMPHEPVNRLSENPEAKPRQDPERPQPAAIEPITSNPAPAEEEQTAAAPESKVHAAHAGVAAPHWSVDVQDEIFAAERKSRTNWSSALSQLLAYCGVGVLTIGTSCVIWGYFGAIPSYLPLGWLTVTFGQMLLFLGLVTLLSNGIETLHSDMESRFDQLLRASRRDAARKNDRQGSGQTP